MKESIIASALLALAGMFLAPRVADATCTSADFTSHNWVLDVQGHQSTSEFLGEGYTINFFVDYNDLGVITPTGATGSFLFTDTENLGNRSVQNQSRSGRITVFSNCTVTVVVFASQAGGPVFYNGVFENGNTVIDLVSVDSGFIVRGTLTQYNPPAPCSLASLSGTFALSLGGSEFPLLDLVKNNGFASDVPFAAVGPIVFDGNGNFTGSATISNGGSNVQNAALSGEYTLNGCTGALTMLSGLVPVNFNIIIESTKRLLLVSSQSRFAISGEAVVQ